MMALSAASALMDWWKRVNSEATVDSGASALPPMMLQAISAPVLSWLSPTWWMPTASMARPTMACTQVEKLIASAASRRVPRLSLATKSTTSSHLRCICAAAPQALTASIAPRVSINSAFLASLARKTRRMRSRIGSCSASPMPATMGMAISGTAAIAGPPIMPITTMNSSTKGRSISEVMVAEVKKSRSDSNSRRLLARLPTDSRPASSRRAINCSNSADDKAMSARRPATSMNQPRSSFSPKSNRYSSTMPAVRAQKVSSARFGTTRS